MRNFTHGWSQSRYFFSKLGHFFPIFKKGQGRPPHIPPLVTHLLKLYQDMYFIFYALPKTFDFSGQFVVYSFFSKSIFFESKLFSLKFSNRRKNNQDTIISVFQKREHLLILQGAVRNKNKFQSKHSLLLVDAFLYFTVPMVFSIRMFQYINIRKTDFQANWITEKKICK